MSPMDDLNSSLLVNENQPPSGFPKRKTETKKVLLEGLLVAVVGMMFAWCANQISPRGLALNRDFFPGANRPSRPLLTATNLKARVTGGPANTLSSAELLAARLKANGLQLAGSNEVMRLFHDPRYEQELVVFIDAREDKDYQEGHIPGAYQLDHYHPEN